MQLGPNGVQTLNLLEDGLLPYTTINGSTFPAPDPALIKAAPLPSDPAYSSKIIDFVKENAPDTFEGMPVNFSKTFTNTVSYEDAFPRGDGPSSLLPAVQSADLGRADLKAGARSEEQQLRVSALPARDHALRRWLQVHPGAAPGRLSEGAA